MIEDKTTPNITNRKTSKSKNTTSFPDKYQPTFPR